jgi:hypothetical protein
MNYQPLTEILVSDQYGQLVDLLMTGLPGAVVVLFVATLILIFYLCQEEMRAGSTNARTHELAPSQAGAPVVTLNVEHPTWNFGPALLNPEQRAAA